MKYRRSEAVTSPSSLAFGGLFSFRFNSSQRPLEEAFQILNEWQHLHANGFRVLPPKPSRAGKGGRRRVFSRPEMKVALLGVVVAKRESWTGTRPPSDADLVRLIKTKGYFPDWEVSTLKVELSRAWRWFRSEEGTNWFKQNEQEVRRLEKAVPEPDKEATVT